MELLSVFDFDFELRRRVDWSRWQLVWATIVNFCYSLAHLLLPSVTALSTISPAHASPFPSFCTSCRHPSTLTTQDTRCAFPAWSHSCRHRYENGRACFHQVCLLFCLTCFIEITFFFFLILYLGIFSCADTAILPDGSLIHLYTTVTTPYLSFPNTAEGSHELRCKRALVTTKSVMLTHVRSHWMTSGARDRRFRRNLTYFTRWLYSRSTSHVPLLPSSRSRAKLSSVCLSRCFHILESCLYPAGSTLLHGFLVVSSSKTRKSRGSQ